jgi:hypothetical protein
VPSSTSSSERGGIRRAVPGGPWGLTWALALPLAAAALVQVEQFVRVRGYRPSVTDDEYLWTIERSKASSGDRRTIVLLGDSRMELDVATAELRGRLPGYRVIQLALEYTTPRAALADLAADDDFRGLVVVGVIEWVLGNDDERDTLERYVAAGHRRWRSPGAIAERWLATEAQSRLALLSATGRRTLERLISRHRWPPAIYLATQRDRSRLADYTLKNVDARRRQYEDRLRGVRLWKKSRAEWLRRAMRLEPYVDAIRARGGEVVFVRMPMSGPLERASDASFPRRTYWDRFARTTSARTIHYLDHPAMRGFNLPDDSHLDMRDAPRFTRGLVDALVALSVIPAADLAR